MYSYQELQAIAEKNRKMNNSRQLLIDHEEQILKYANNLLKMLSKASRNQIIDDSKDECCKIIAACETFKNILEKT